MENLFSSTNLERYSCNADSKIKSAWQELVGRFADRINADRQQAGYKKLPYTYFAMKLGDTKMTHWECEQFYSECDRSGCFGKVFFGKLKPLDEK